MKIIQSVLVLLFFCTVFLAGPWGGEGDGPLPRVLRTPVVNLADPKMREKTYECI